jgi:hypothetical protein
LKKEEEQTMKRKVKFLVGVLLILTLVGCAETKPIVYNLSGWETGKIINLQYADKVIVIEDYNFEKKPNSYLGGSPAWTENRIVKGNIADCLVAGLRGAIPGYAVIKEEDLKNVNPKAQVVRIKPIDVGIKWDAHQTKFNPVGFIASIKIELYYNGKKEVLSAKGSGTYFLDTFANACENMAVKVNKVFEKNN